jgi:hypothetical protein
LYLFIYIHCLFNVSLCLYVQVFLYPKGFICNKEYYKTKGVSLFNDTGGVR